MSILYENYSSVWRDDGGDSSVSIVPGHHQSGGGLRERVSNSQIGNISTLQNITINSDNKLNFLFILFSVRRV